MGFRVEKQSDSGCVIKAVLEGDDGGEFLLCVQQALKNLWLDITVDMSQKPYALASIMPHLLKLQQVIGNRHKVVVMKGIHGRVSPDFLNQISDIGIIILQDSVPIPILRPGPFQEPATDMGGRTVESRAPGESRLMDMPVPLPPAPEVAKRFLDLQERLAQAVKRKRFLENEYRTYRDRIKNLSKGHGDWQVDLNQIRRISDLEAELNQLKNDRNLLQKDADSILAEVDQEAERTKKLKSEYQSDYKLKKDNLDKSMAELTKKYEKEKQELKKKSDSRKERLARMARDGKT